MSELANWAAWLSHILAWVLVAWLALALFISVPWIISDEIRIRQRAPKHAEVADHADHLEALHGADGLEVVSIAMTEALQHGDFQMRRFLKEVSHELARRRYSRHCDSASDIF